MANKRLDKALAKLTQNEKKLLEDHFNHKTILETYFELKDAGKDVGNYNICLRYSSKDFIKISILNGK